MVETRSLAWRLAGVHHGLVTRFTGLFLVMAAIVAATGLFGLSRIALVGGAVQQLVRSRAAQEKTAVLMKVSVQESRVHLLEAATAFKEAEEFDPARDDYEMLRERFHGYVTLLLEGNDEVGMPPAPAGGVLEQKLHAVRTVWSGFEAAAARLLARKAGLMQAAAAEGAAARETPGDPQLNELIREDIFAASGKVETAIDDLLVTVGALSNETRDQVAEVQRRARIALAWVVVAAVGVALLLGMAATSLLVIRPLTEMRRAAERIAGGDLTHTLAVRGRGEIAQLGEAVNAMAANLKQMFQRVREVAEGLSRSADGIVVSAQQVMSAAEVQKTVIEATAAAAADLSASNAVVAAGAHELSRSAAGASTVISRTGQAIDRVAGGSDVLESSSSETAASVHEMVVSIREISQGLARLSASSERIASSVTQVTSSTRQIEHHANESVGLAEKVLSDASGRGAAAAADALAGIDHIRSSVGALGEAVNSLGKRSQDIGSILTIIDDIAERTNLLALNAAILSAQAGEHGRGFAVVASQIKLLADKTSKSVKEIGALIGAVREETSASVAHAAVGLQSVDAGLRLVRGVEEALGSIAQSSVASAEMAKAIRRSTTAEAQAVSQIAHAIQEMAGQVENISHALQEQNSGSAFMIGQTEKMKEISAQVRESIGEQRQGGVHMLDAIGAVTRQAEAIADATGVQKLKGAEIVGSMQRMQETTGTLVASSNELRTTVGALETAAQKLHDELEKFKV